MDVTVAERLTDSRLLQLSKALVPMIVTPDGMEYWIYPLPGGYLTSLVLALLNKMPSTDV